MKSLLRKYVMKLLGLGILGFLIANLPWCEYVNAVSTTPAWKPSELIMNSSYDNQRGDRFLAFDHYGVPSVVTITTTGAVSFARQVDGVGWKNRTIGGVNAKHASLAFDRRELPGISFGADNGLNYSYFSTTTGTFLTNLVDNTAVTGRQWTLGTAVAFDLYGRPAMAATRNDGNFGDLFYISDTNRDGVLSSADLLESVTTDPESFPSLTFDRQNRPIIAPRYLSQGIFGDLDVWMKDPFTGWGLSVVSTNAEEGTPDAVTGSIAIDPTDGLPAVAWTHVISANNSQLWYGKWNQLQSQWDLTLVTNNPTSEMGSESLAFDPGDGRPAISYGDKTGNVNFAWFNGTSWMTQVVTNTSTAFAPRTSLAFNEYGHGFPAIAYITNSGAGTGQLRFVVDPPIAVPEPSTFVLIPLAIVALGGNIRSRRVCRQTLLIS